MQLYRLAVLAAGLLLGMSMLTAVRAETVVVAAATATSQPSAPSLVVKTDCFRKGWAGWETYPSCDKRVKKKRHKGMHKQK